MDEGARRKLELFVEEHASEQVRLDIDLSHQNSFSHNKPGTDRVVEMVLERFAGVFPDHRFRECDIDEGELHGPGAGCHTVPELTGQLPAIGENPFH